MLPPPVTSPFTIRVLSWDAARSLARPLREAVFVHEQGVPIEQEWDELDSCSDHAIALTPAGEAIGTARLLPETGSAGVFRIGRMAVLKPWRGCGVGAALLNALLERADGRGARSIVLHAQTHASGFYQRFGFTAEGGEYLEAGIPHFTMRRELLNPPA